MKRKILRSHQQKCVDALRDSVSRGEIPYADCTVGFGKSLVMAEITNLAMRKGIRVLQITPSKELCAQNFEETYYHIDDNLKSKLGILCAGLNKSQQSRQAVICTFGSMLNKRSTSGGFGVVLVDECMTGDVEILTEKGFQRFDSLDKSLRVAQYDNGEISFVEPIRHIEKPYSGEIINLKSEKYIDIDVTPRHELLLNYKDGDRKELAKDACFNHLKNIHVAGECSGNDDFLSDKEKLMIATQADGNIDIHDTRTIHRISFSFSKQRKIDDFLSLMESGGFRFSETKPSKPINKNTKQKRVFHVFDIDYASKDIASFFDISQLSLSKSREIIEYMVKWDGYINKKSGQYYFSNTDEIAVDFYQSVCILSGYKTNKTIQVDNRSENFNDIHRLFITKGKNKVSAQAISKTSRHYDGKVYCVTVPSGNIVVRRNGKPIVIGNCHILSHNEDTSIRKILKSLYRLNPKMIVMGLSGSPYRANSGALENDCVDGKAFFTGCAYTSNIRELMSQGYLSHIENISGDIQADMSSVPIAGSDYNTELMSVKFDAILTPAVADMKKKFKHYGISTAVIYTSNIKNAQHVIDEWGESDEIRILHGGVSNSERKATLEWLKNSEGNRYVVNVNLLITGYNQPSLEAVVFFRATKSLVIYCQSIGRCLRAHDDKVKSYCICYGGNIDRHGAIDNINPPKPKKKRGDAPKKLCEIILDATHTDKEEYVHLSGNACNTPNLLSAKYCSTCGAKFLNLSEDGSYQMRSKAQLLSDKIDDSILNFEVAETDFEIVKSRSGSNAGTPMIKMRMYTPALSPIHEHYLCLNHKGKARDMSKRFLRSLFKNQQDYYKLGSVGVSVENIVPLLTGHYDAFFKKIIAVKIGDQKGNSKYKEIKSLTFED